MSGGRFLTVAEQVAEHLRTELFRGRWKEKLPGLPSLSTELGVNHKTVGTALRILEREGVLVGQGPGRKRKIVIPEADQVRPMRVGILVPVPEDCHVEYIVELRHSLAEAGHDAIVVSEFRGSQGGTNMPRSLTEPEKRLARVKALVEQVSADAWVVTGGSQEVLEWFCAQKKPALALFGRQFGLPIAGCRLDKAPSYTAATRRLMELGHRRIVMLCRHMRRWPEPGVPERAFLNELETNGISPGPYHLPDWEETIEGFDGLLDSLFKHTPPTAMIIDEAPFFVAAMHFLSARGIRVPDQVSMISTDPDPCFAWCRPSVAHIHWDSGPLVRRIVRWAAAVSNGKQDMRQITIPTQFVPGGSIGRVNM